MSYIYNLKFIIMKTKNFMLGLAMAFSVIACTKNEDDNDSTTITSTEAIVNSKIDDAVDDVSNAIDEQVEATQRTSVTAEANSTNCPTVTRVPAFFTTTIPITAIIPEIGSTVTKKINFGNGCQLANGNVLKGIINVSFIYNPAATTRAVTYTFENFFHNLRQINGTKTFTKTLTATGFTVVMSMDLTVTLVDGSTFKREGTRTRTIIEGYSTPLDFTDNVYQITGNWTTTYPGDNIQTSTITTPLIYKLACLPTNFPIVSGVITFNRNGKTATLDYGNGICDKTAVFTYKGIAVNIVLGK